MKDQWDEMAKRLVELVTEDKELHDAVVKLINARAGQARANAEYELARAERVRKRTRRKSTS